ncbi:recombinase family protein [Gluconobacter sphaericus]|uniref:recombinase family protein n=1 Tax=Gluconobacter sphaericus TaxID=574987 RepID=UPI002012B656|nr:recombinase family protein [Gluconobacter sphaericus]
MTERRVRVRILNIGIETGTPNAQLFLTILAGFAQFERELIRERTRAGLAAIRLAGEWTLQRDSREAASLESLLSKHSLMCSI